METFTASSAKLLVFVENQSLRDKYSTKSFWCQTSARDVAALSRPEIRFLRYLKKKHVNAGFSSSLSVSFHRKTILPISSSAAPLPETCATVEEVQNKDTTQFKTVHVKFQLQRECSFGQQFLMVGDDPMFGLWDPSSAIPLNWSEGHVWTVEMDIPCDKVMKYKFILKGGDDSVLWQPGPDRILQTLETGKTITVCEDWDNAELQTIIEGDPVTHQLNESKDNPEELIITENLFQHSGNIEELISTSGYARRTQKPFDEKPMEIVAENIAEQDEEKAVEINGLAGASFATNPNNIVTSGVNEHQNKERSGSNENSIVTKDDKNLDTGAAIPVLVPGLTPVPTAEIEESSYKTQEFNVPELNLKEEPGIHFPIPKEDTEMILLNDKLEQHDKGHAPKHQLSEEKDQDNDTGVEDTVLENDIQWGRRTLQKFLMNLGFL